MCFVLTSQLPHFDEEIARSSSMYGQSSMYLSRPRKKIAKKLNRVAKAEGLQVNERKRFKNKGPSDGNTLFLKKYQAVSNSKSCSGTTSSSMPHLDDGNPISDCGKLEHDATKHGMIQSGLHGTTVVAFFFEDGIILAVDSRVTYLTLTREQLKRLREKRNVDYKIRRFEITDNIDKCEVKSNIVMLWAGSADAASKLAKHMDKNWPEPIKTENKVPCSRYSVNDVVEVAKKWMDHDRSKNLGLTTIIAGWSEESQALELWRIKSLWNETTKKYDQIEVKAEPFVFTGSGGTYASEHFHTLMKTKPETPECYNRKMSENEAEDVILRCLLEASKYDKSTGGALHVYTLDNNGVCTAEVRAMEAFHRYFPSSKEQGVLLCAYSDSGQYDGVHQEDLECRFRASAPRIARLARVGPSYKESRKGFHLHQLIFKTPELAKEAIQEAAPHGWSLDSKKEPPNARSLQSFFRYRLPFDTSTSPMARSDAEKDLKKKRWLYLDWCSEELLGNLDDVCVEIHPELD